MGFKQQFASEAELAHLLPRMKGDINTISFKEWFRLNATKQSGTTYRFTPQNGYCYKKHWLRWKFIAIKQLLKQAESNGKKAK